MEEKEALVIAEFRKRRNRQLLASVPMIVALIFLFMLKDMGASAFPAWIPEQLILPVCLGVVGIGVIFTLGNWKCPVCKRYLGKSFAPRYCQKCGAQLQE